MCGNMVLWNGAREILHLFCSAEWETSSHIHAILGVRLILQQSTVCPPIWWCPPPDTTILGGF